MQEHIISPCISDPFQCCKTLFISLFFLFYFFFTLFLSQSCQSSKSLITVLFLKILIWFLLTCRIRCSGSCRSACTWCGTLTHKVHFSAFKLNISCMSAASVFQVVHCYLIHFLHISAEKKSLRDH